MSIWIICIRDGSNEIIICDRAWDCRENAEEYLRNNHGINAYVRELTLD